MRIVVLVMFALLTAGCASAPPLNFSVQGLGVSNSKIDADLRSISVSFAGPNEARGEIPSSGEEVPGYWESALREGVNRISVFDDDSPQKVNIFVKVTELDISGGGFEMTTEARATYQVVSRKSGKVLYERDISTVGSVPASYAFLGSTRIKESINRAVQKNIRAFLDALSTAKIRT